MGITAAEPAGELPLRPQLRLVREVEHVHRWRLTCVEHDEAGQVRMFECATCPEVHYE